MARKAFSGDHIKELPRGKVEPYRLWFEFLKLALEVQPEKVDKKFYEPWGNVSNERFNDWFSQNWRKLFATPASLTVVSSASEAQGYLDDPKSLLIRVDKSGPVKRQIEDFKKILKAHREPSGKRVYLKPPFEIASNRSMNNASLRAMLKLLAFFYAHGGKIDEATKNYYSWATAWNAQVKYKKWNRELIRIPSVLATFAKEIELHENLLAQNGTRVKKRDQYYGSRSDAGRFLRKARKILDNVSFGKFPGVF